MNQQIAAIRTPLAWVCIHAANGAIERIAFSDEPRGEKPTSDLLRLASTELLAYFEGDATTFTMPLAERGTAFQRAVWQAVRNVGYANTASYLDVARTIGNPKAVRAVGLANGQNPWPIVIPCHRVIGSNGKLTGYAFGLERKSWLLNWEASRAGRSAALVSTFHR